MSIIGITGSIASGKSRVAHIIAGKKNPLFSADKVVLNLYKNKKFIKILIKKFNLNSKKKIKEQIKLLIKKNRKNLYKLESLIHPIVRKNMKSFLKKKNKILVLEIPLLIESRLNSFFDKVVFVHANEEIRKKRYIKKGGNIKTFNMLNQRQLSPVYKKKLSDYTINNNYSLVILKKNVKIFLKQYE